MATEILGFLIIVGILIVFIVRRDLWNGASNKADEVEEASVKMRLQMEHTMNTLITQMDSRIHQIEGLVAAADDRARALEQQMAAVREEQESSQRRAEQEFAAMRAEQARYYTPPEEPRPYDGMRDIRQTWEDYRRARTAAQDRSFRPVEGVAAVHRATYAAPVRVGQRVETETFADTLSASMHTAGVGYDDAYSQNRATYYEPARERRYAENGGYRREAAGAYDERYEGRGYREPYDAVPYPAEPYPGEEALAQYVEPNPHQNLRPSRLARSYRQAEEIPAEMVVEETPAVIVDSNFGPHRDIYAHEEEEEESGAFSQEQLEELANTEAEVVVSSSVADVVDLPINADEEEAEYDEEQDQDVHAYAEPEEDNAEIEEEEFPEDEEDDEPQEMIIAPGASPELEEIGDSWEEEETETEGTEEAAEEDYEETLTDSDEPESLEEVEAEEPEAAVQADETVAWDEVKYASALAADHVLETDEDTPTEPQENGDAEQNEPEEIPFDEIHVRMEAIGPKASAADDSIRPPSPAIHARKLLAGGMSIDEVARETGMGRSAVELLAQMAGGREKTAADD